MGWSSGSWAEDGQTISFPLSFPFALFLLGREKEIGMPHLNGREP